MPGDDNDVDRPPPVQVEKIIASVFGNRGDKRFRAGLLDGLVLFGVITQRQWLRLSAKYLQRKGARRE